MTPYIWEQWPRYFRGIEEVRAQIARKTAVEQALLDIDETHNAPRCTDANPRMRVPSPHFQELYR